MTWNKIKIYAAAALLWSTECWAGQLSARVEPQKIQYGETVQLEVSYEGENSGVLQPHFEVLNDDFAVYSTSTSMQTQYANGVSQQRRVWSLTLMPQREGKVTIPAITAGNYQTVPLNIEVLPSGSSSVQSGAVQSSTGTSVAAQNADFWVDMTVDEKKPYVQQEINGTLVIYDNKNIQFTQDPIFENADDWEIKQLDEPVITNKNGQRIIKIKYAFFPQKSGNLTLPRITVKGYYVERKTGDLSRSVNGLLQLFEINFDVTDLVAQQKPIMLKTKPIAIEVKPIPSDYGQDWWLPSAAVSLRARWADPRPVFKVGEAVTREITLSASGVAENQLPVLEFAENEAWKQYPENPVISSTVKNGEVVSTAVTRVVYIPQRGGEQSLPEVKLRWYNVKTHHIEKAMISAEKMYIGGATGVSHTAAVPTMTPTDAPDAVVEAVKNRLENKPDNQQEQKQQKRDIWLIAAVIFGAFLCGAICNYLFLRRKITDTGENYSEDFVRDIEKNLHRSDYRALRDSLLRWGEQMYTDAYINNLNDLSVQIKAPEFTEQMQLLNRNLYAGGAEKPDGKVILKYVKNRQKAKSNPKKPPLPDLYK